jgi:AraC-like DNA-binding protein
MEYRTYEPSPELAKQIKTYWSLDGGKNDEPHTRERIFPDGCIELIFNHGDRFKKYDSETEFHLQPPGFIHGQLKTYFELEATGRVGIFSARFHPAGLQPFVNFDVGTFTGRTLTITEVWGEDGSGLEQAIKECTGYDEKITILEKFLLGKRQALKVDNAPVEYCVESMFTSVGTVSIEKLAEELDISKRQLERRFTAAVGISPKLLARIIRFQNILHLIESKEFKSFTTIAYEGGFYDQAHFIKDFKDFTGLNPKQYFSENLEMVKHFSFDNQ